jgi:hypothetical protein
MGEPARRACLSKQTTTELVAWLLRAAESSRPASPSTPAGGTNTSGPTREATATEPRSDRAADDPPGDGPSESGTAQPDPNPSRPYWYSRVIERRVFPWRWRCRPVAGPGAFRSHAPHEPGGAARHRQRSAGLLGRGGDERRPHPDRRRPGPLAALTMPSRRAAGKGARRPRRASATTSRSGPSSATFQPAPRPGRGGRRSRAACTWR